MRAAPVGATDDSAHSPFPPAPRVARGLAGLILLLTTVAYLAEGAGNLNLKEMQPDFEYFYKAGASLLDHGVTDPGYDRSAAGAVTPRGRLDWYWPFVGRVMTLPALLPQRVAGALWQLFNFLVLVAVLRWLGQEWSGFQRADWPVTQLIPYLALAMFFWWEFKLNQIDLLTLGCVVLSFVVWQRGQAALAGFWLGLAVLIKITPGLLIVWFLLKRQVRTVGAALVTIVLAGPAADAIIFGPAHAADVYREWFHNAVTLGSHGGIITHQREVDWRNQGLGAVTSRWLHETNWNTQFDNDPRAESADAPRFLNVANLDRALLARGVSGVMAVALLVLLWIWRKPAAQLSFWQLRYEFALGLVAMLFFMPVLRRYHLIWLLPALTMFGPALHVTRFRTPWAWLTLGVVGGLIGVQALLSVMWALPEPDNHVPEAAGALLFSVVGVALPLVLMLRKLARDPGALPAMTARNPRLARAGDAPSSEAAAHA